VLENGGLAANPEFLSLPLFKYLVFGTGSKVFALPTMLNRTAWNPICNAWLISNEFRLNNATNLCWIEMKR
jgi:hypothetical protein